MNLFSIFMEMEFVIFKLLYFLKDFFQMWTIFKVFIEFVTIQLLLCFGFLPMRHVGSKLSNQGSYPYSLHWEAKS